MKINTILMMSLLAFILCGCSSLIYAIRGPKYEDKFEQECYLSMLEDQYFYMHRDRSENFNDSLSNHGNDTIKITRNYSKHSYMFLRYDRDGKIRIKEIAQDTLLENIPSKSEIDQLPVLNEMYYIIKDSLIKYEVYHDSYNGYNLYRTKVYSDSLVSWQIGISKMYIGTYKPIDNN